MFSFFMLNYFIVYWWCKARQSWSSACQCFNRTSHENFDYVVHVIISIDHIELSKVW